MFLNQIINKIIERDFSGNQNKFAVASGKARQFVNRITNGEKYPISISQRSFIELLRNAGYPVNEQLLTDTILSVIMPDYFADAERAEATYDILSEDIQKAYPELTVNSDSYGVQVYCTEIQSIEIMENFCFGFSCEYNKPNVVLLISM